MLSCLNLTSNRFAGMAIHSCAKIMAEEVTNLFNGSLDHFSELFFDDRTLLSEDNEKY
jgi:hypothetical protein